MQYKITRQYAQDAENLLAEFLDHAEAIFFIDRKILFDAEKNAILIYRLFDHEKLIREFNKEKINSGIRNAEYAEGDKFFPNSMGPYKVSKDSSALNALAAFVRLDDAEFFVEDKLTQLSIITTYYIFRDDEIIAEMNQRVKKKR